MKTEKSKTLAPSNHDFKVNIDNLFKSKCHFVWNTNEYNAATSSWKNYEK